MTTATPISTGRPEIPRAKRAGLDVDLHALCAAGVDLDLEDRYRLETYGVRAQRQTGAYMVRLRVPGGRLDAQQVAAVARASRAHAGGLLHLTTRQNIELHSVRLEAVPDLYDSLEPLGLAGRSACGHTVRNIMACPEAEHSAEEPFDVSVDARWLSEQLVARSEELNVALPSRINIHLGGCSTCALAARTNDIGLVACLRDGEPGYQVWAGGSLGSGPRLSLLLRAFVPRSELWPWVWAILVWFYQEGDIDQLSQGRLKHLIADKGEPAFRTKVARLVAGSDEDGQPHPPPIEVPGEPVIEQALADAPPGGWRDGVRPQRTPGLAAITVRAPLGDLQASELERIVDLSPDDVVTLGRDQNVLIPSVPVRQVPAVLSALADMELGPDGARGAVDVRACTGLTFCSLAMTDSQQVALAVEQTLNTRPDLPNDVTIAVSGCPNSCSRHQAADIGLAGTQISVDGRIQLGYHLVLGADIAAGAVGEPVVQIVAEEAPDAVVAAVEAWKVLRRPGEPPGPTFRRLGLDLTGRIVEQRLRQAAWDRHPEPHDKEVRQ